MECVIVTVISFTMGPGYRWRDGVFVSHDRCMGLELIESKLLQVEKGH
jgi:hypothetical protein